MDIFNYWNPFWYFLANWKTYWNNVCMAIKPCRDKEYISSIHTTCGRANTSTHWNSLGAVVLAGRDPTLNISNWEIQKNNRSQPSPSKTVEATDSKCKVHPPRVPWPLQRLCYSLNHGSATLSCATYLGNKQTSKHPKQTIKNVYTLQSKCPSWSLVKTVIYTCISQFPTDLCASCPLALAVHLVAHNRRELLCKYCAEIKRAESREEHCLAAPRCFLGDMV